MATQEKLFDLWAKRNPVWDTRYEDNIIKTFADYGRGADKLNASRGKLFGAGYELFIIAFFIGLYADQRRPLPTNSNETKTFGQPIQFWGNLDSVKTRKAYPKIREYMFMALIARTDIDFIALERGDIKASTVVSQMMSTMEEYANWGFHFMWDKMCDDPNYFYKETALLEIFMSFKPKDPDRLMDDEPESLD